MLDASKSLFCCLLIAEISKTGYILQFVSFEEQVTEMPYIYHPNEMCACESMCVGGARTTCVIFVRMLCE